MVAVRGFPPPPPEQHWTWKNVPRACRSGESSAGWPAPGFAVRRVPPAIRPRDPQGLTGSASGDRAGSTGCTYSWAYWPGRDWLPVSVDGRRRKEERKSARLLYAVWFEGFGFF